MLDGIFGGNLYLLEKSLDLRLARQNLIASNLANAETPGFRAMDMNFEEVLIDIANRQKTQNSGEVNMQALNGGAVSAVRLRLMEQNTAAVRPDGNSVQMEKELGKLSKNALMYRAQAQFLGKKLALIKGAIQTP